MRAGAPATHSQEPWRRNAIAFILPDHDDDRSGGDAVTVLSLDHVQLAMPSGREDDARAFYAGLLGLAEVAKPVHLTQRGGCWFESGAVKVHLGVEEVFAPARKAHPAFVVDDLAETADRLEQAGYSLRSDQPLEGFERSYVDDPFGNRIELLQRTGRLERQAIRSAYPFEDAYGYARAVRVGNQVFVAGTTARGADLDADAKRQTEGAIAIVEAALREAGVALRHVVRTVVYVVDLADTERVARAHRAAFGAVPPASTLVKVAALTPAAARVEIEATAIVWD